MHIQISLTSNQLIYELTILRTYLFFNLKFSSICLCVTKIMIVAKQNITKIFRIFLSRLKFDLDGTKKKKMEKNTKKKDEKNMNFSVILDK